MDVARTHGTRWRWLRRGLFLVGAALLLGGTTYAFSILKRAAPVMDADSVWTAAVERGEMLRQVRGNGTLVPAEVRWIPAPAEGRVENIPYKPGETVSAETVLIELSNPVLERDLLNSEWELDAAEAGRRNLETEIETQQLGLQESIAVAEGELRIAKLQADRDRQLLEEGLSAQYVLDVSFAQLEAIETRVKLMRQRLEQMESSVEAQLAVQQAKVEQLRGLVSLRRRQLDDLQVKAGASGVLQQVMVEVGQQVTPATTLARVAQPDQLKAELQVSETQMRDVQVGQSVDIDTRNGIVRGRVGRIDPAVVNGAVKVEAILEGELPKGARPDLSVEGVIEIERLNDVLHVARPVGSRPETRVGLFRLSKDGDFAARTPVLLGRGSVNAMEIVEGLNEGDRVIISDMSKWEAVDRVCLK